MYCETIECEGMICEKEMSSAGGGKQLRKVMMMMLTQYPTMVTEFVDYISGQNETKFIYFYIYIFFGSAPVLCTVNCCCSVAPLSAILGLGVNFIVFTINDFIYIVHHFTNYHT